MAELVVGMEKLDAGARRLGLHLSPIQLEQFTIYYRELINWNQRVNLTAITDYEEVQAKHFLDSLALTLALKLSVGGVNLRVVDVGTGAGLPGIPLKIILPDVDLVLVEATAKKADFLCHVKHKLGLDNIKVVVGRAETVAHDVEYREKFDLVVSRAVAHLPVLVELTLPFCDIGGGFIAQKKGDIDLEVSQATRVINLLGGRLWEVKRVKMEEFTDVRWLVVIDKIKPTPEKYPRRPGIPAKRPLV